MERRGAKEVGIGSFDENSGVKGDKFDWLIAWARHLQYIARIRAKVYFMSGSEKQCTKNTPKGLGGGTVTKLALQNRPHGGPYLRRIT
jgi:hypothetical protein